MSDEERARAALDIWNREKNAAAIVISAGWLFKVRAGVCSMMLLFVKLNPRP
jgi:hypothetical protein